MHCLGSAYGCRPSQVLQLEDPWAAYQLDLAALLVGGHIEHETADGKKSAGDVIRAMEWRRDRGAGRLDRESRETERKTRKRPSGEYRSVTALFGRSGVVAQIRTGDGSDQGG